MARVLALLLILPVATLASAADAPKAVNEQAYELPPFVITQPGLGTNWSYGSIPGFEVLSQCSARETREVVAALWRGRRVILPESLRPRFSQPMIVIVFAEGKAGEGLVPLGSQRGANEIRTHWTNVIKRTLEDRESFAINLWNRDFKGSPAFRFDLFTLLRRVAPAPPAWLDAGMFGGLGLYREGYYWYPGGKQKSLISAAWCDQKELKRALALVDQARRVRLHPAPETGPSPVAPCILPLQQLLEAAPPAAGPAFDRWSASAALFTRWGTYDCPPEQTERFWRYVDRVRREPPTEAVFREHFGLSYAEADAALSWYLPIAASGPGWALPGEIEPMPELTLQEARPRHVARLRGEWERMEAVALARSHPDLARRYRDQAAKTLKLGTADPAKADPAIHASLGLLALDDGDLVRARGHLELAVAGRVPGPRAYLELARLRWNADRLDDRGTLPPASLTQVVDLILAAEAEQPPLLSVYLLLTEALRRSGPPTPAQTAALLRGRDCFPRHADLQRRIDALLSPPRP